MSLSSSPVHPIVSPVFDSALSAPTSTAPGTAPRSTILRWPGASGRWYAHTVFAWDRLPEIEGANFILVAAQGRDEGRPLYIGSAAALSRELALRPEWSAAQMQGLTHVHVHLLAADGAEREAIRADLAACVATPLNAEPLSAEAREGLSAATRLPTRGFVRVRSELGPDGNPVPNAAIGEAGSGAAVRWLGGRQAAPRAQQFGPTYILPQTPTVRRAG
jgi:hypothetical protein